MSEAAAAAAPERRIVGKKALCEEVLHWSRMRLDRRLESDPLFPVLKRGTQAGGWQFDADQVLFYLGATVDDPEDGADAPAARVDHAQEETARSRLNLAQAQLAETKLRERRGELMEVADLRMALSETVTKVSTGLNNLPDILVRRLKLPDAAVDVIRQEIDQIRRGRVLGLRDSLGPHG